MTLLEKLNEAKKNLSSLVGNTETKADDMNNAIKAVEEIQEQIKAAEKAEKLLAGLAPKEKELPADENMKTKSIGEMVAEKVAGFDFKHEKKAFSVKTAAPMVKPASIEPAITDYDTNIVTGFRRKFMIRELFGSERVTGDSLKFFVESSTVEGSISTTTEGQAKPFISFGDPTAVRVELEKIPAYTKMSTELMHDAPFLADYINGRLIYEQQLATENFLVNKLTNTSGIGTANKLTPDGIYKAMTTVFNSSGVPADALVINPADYQNIRLRKDVNGQYYGGGFMTGAYGNGEITEQPGIWGLRTILTPAVPIGTAFVGAFKFGASVLTGTDGFSVNMANQNEDDFIKNLVTILVEERLALAVRRPACFVKITGQSTSTEA